MKTFRRLPILVLLALVSILDSSAHAAKIKSVSVEGMNKWREKRIKQAKGNIRPLGQIPLEDCRSRLEKYRSKGFIDQEDVEFFLSIEILPDIDEAGKYYGPLAICGCFHPEVSLLTVNRGTGEFESLTAQELESVVSKDNPTHLIAHLTEDSKIEQFELSAAPVSQFTKGKELLPLVVVEAENGKKLKLTTEHAVLKLDGTLVPAKALNAGDHLLTAEGSTVAVTSIGSEQFDGEVLNFEVGHTKGNVEHIIFAEEIAVGDLAWQNSLQSELHKVTVRQ